MRTAFCRLAASYLTAGRATRLIPGFDIARPPFGSISSRRSTTLALALVLALKADIEVLPS
jgi:hypothetical protein